MSSSIVFKNVSLPISETWPRLVAVPKVSLQTKDMWRGADTWLQTDSKKTIIVFANHNDKQYYPLGLHMQTTIAYNFDVRLADNS